MGTNDMKRPEDGAPLLGAEGPKPKLTLATKLAFGAGAAPAALANTVIGFFFTTFLLEVAAVRPATVSAILLIGRVWDALMDPAVGFLTSRTNTRWGQLRPWIGAAALPFALSYMALWVVPATGQSGKLLYYLVVFLVYQTLFSAYHMPYTALTMHLSNDSVERDSATSFRMVFEVVCVLFANVFQGVIISNLKDNNEQYYCRNCSIDIDDAPFTRTSERTGYALAGICIAVLVALTALIVFFFVKEQPHDAVQAKKTSLTFIGGLKHTLKNRNYMTLTMLYLWVWMGVQVTQSSYILWLKYCVNRVDVFQQLMISLLVSALVCVIAWFFIIQKLGKRNSFIVGLMLSIPSCVFMFMVPEKAPLWMLHFSAIYGGFGLSCTYLLPWTMLPDVIDLDELLNGVRREALYYSFFVFFQKMAAGIAVGISTLALDLAGYITDPCCGETQPTSIGDALRLMLGVVPIVLNFLSLVFTLMYPITPEMAKATKQRLEDRRALTASETMPLESRKSESPVSDNWKDSADTTESTA